MGAFVALCAFAGLRLGEAAALQVGDVVVTVQRALGHASATVTLNTYARL